MARKERGRGKTEKKRKKGKKQSRNQKTNTGENDVRRIWKEEEVRLKKEGEKRRICGQIG